MVVFRMCALLVALVLLGGCGSDSNDGGTASQEKAAPRQEPSAQERNDQAIQEAEQGQDNQAQQGEAAIRKTLKKKLNLNAEDEFDLDGEFDEGQIGGDCYVKLGAEAANFEGESQNILSSPNGTDLVFVQSSTSAPLVKCLKAVRSALDW